MSLAAETRRGGLDRLRDRFRSWRNALVANPRFQRLCADLPLVRRIGEHHAGSLFDLCAGFVYSQILLAVIRLDLLAILAERPLSVAEIGVRTGLGPEGARRLADAATALGLLERAANDTYAVGLLGAALAGTPGLADMIEHHGAVYADFADPVALLARRDAATALGTFWDYDEAEAQRTARYSQLMASTQGFVQADVLDSYDFGSHRRILDVGGGDGTFLAGIGRRWQAPQLVLFDRPPVAALATRRFAAEGLAHRSEAHGGDFRTDPLPAGADLVTLVRVLHDHDDETVGPLVSSICRTLRPGGRILIAEPMAETPGAERMGHAYFGFYLLAMGRGRPRSATEIGALLAASGFTRVRRIRTRRPGMVSIVSALSP